MNGGPGRHIGPGDAPAPAPQRIVVFTGDDGKPTVYSAVYSNEQADLYLLFCARDHGAESKPRVRRA
jgi:hypothetical protein